MILGFEVEDNWSKIILKVEVYPVPKGSLVGLDGKGYW